MSELPLKSNVSTAYESGEIELRIPSIVVSSIEFPAQVTVNVDVLPDVKSQVHGLIEVAGGHRQMAVVRAEKAVESLHVPSGTNVK